MKKICLLLIIAILALSMIACKAETVTLHCDAEGCENTVEVKVEGENTPDDSWIIFCDDCDDNILAD